MEMHGTYENDKRLIKLMIVKLIEVAENTAAKSGIENRLQKIVLTMGD